MEKAKKFVCPHCTSVNHIEETTLNITVKCTQCNEAIYNGEPLTLNDQNFAPVIAKTDLPIIVDFWSIACAPCKAMNPAYAEASEALFPKVILAKLNIELSPQTTEKYDIRGLPTLVVFKNGQSVTRKVGAMTLQQIVEWVSSEI